MMNSTEKDPGKTTVLVSKNPIVRKIADREAKEGILDLLLLKQLPFTEEEYLEALVFVMKDEGLKPKALNLLKDIPGSTKLNYIEKSRANQRVAYYIVLEALSGKNVKVIARAARNQALPHEFLLKIAEKGDLAMLEVLLDNQIKMIAYPGIMEIMEKNPAADNFILSKITEIREFYLKEEAEEIPEEAVLKDDAVKEAISSEQHGEKGTAEEDAGELDDLDSVKVVETALTTLQEINKMSISERIKLALGGSKTHRMILVKDPNKMVALSVVESPKITTDEVVLLARNKSIDGEIIAKVSRNREWIKNYPIILELVQNPKTPVKDALGFIKKLHMRDLKQASKNKNINPVVRTLALNYYTEKTGTVKKV